MHRYDIFNEAFASLFQVNMGVEPGERILVFSDLVRLDETVSDVDRERRTRLHGTAFAASRFAAGKYGNSLFVDFPATHSSGAEPPEALWRATFGEKVIDDLSSKSLFIPLLTKTATEDEIREIEEIFLCKKHCHAVDVIVALSNNSTSHTRFRKLACLLGTRFASLPHFDPDMFFSSMQVDWAALAARTARLANIMKNAVEIRLTTPNGTEMIFSSAGRTAEGDDGLLTSRGSFGNLPAGEVYLAPVEGCSSGTLVLEYAPTCRLAKPLTLKVKDGLVEKVEGDDLYADRLREVFAANPLARNIAELGIGTNDKASRPDNILEAEKILGTVHVALGDNSGFGGKVQVAFHEDYIFYNPTLTIQNLDGLKTIILDRGSLVV